MFVDTYLLYILLSKLIYKNNCDTSMSILRKFIIGSNVSIFPIFYTGLYFYKKNSVNISRSKFARTMVILPFLYGCLFVILDVILSRAITNLRTRLFVMGAISGLIYSLIGRFLLHLPSKIYYTNNPNLVHLYAPIMYSLIYGFYVYYLYINLCK